MTYEETREILKVLKANYFNHFRSWDREQGEAFLSLWSEAFKNDDTQVVVKAVKSIIYTDKSDFPPTIGKVKNEMFKSYESYQVDSGEAWEMVLRSAKCDYQKVKECFDNMPANIQRAVGSPSFLVELGYSDRDSTGFARKEFERKYQMVLNREKELVLSGEIPYAQIEANNTQPQQIESGMKSVKALLGK